MITDDMSMEMILHGEVVMRRDAATGEWELLTEALQRIRERLTGEWEYAEPVMTVMEPEPDDRTFLSLVLQAAVAHQARRHPAFQWRPTPTAVLYGRCSGCNSLKPLDGYGYVAPHSRDRLLLVMCVGSNEHPTAGAVPDPGGQPCPRHGDWYLELQPCTCGHWNWRRRQTDRASVQL